MDLLEWNHAHRSHKYATKEDRALYLKSRKQFLAAGRSPQANLIDDYDTHLWNDCPICNDKGLVHTEVRRAKEAEEQKRRDHEREQKSKAQAEEAAKMERWSKYGWRVQTEEEKLKFRELRTFPNERVKLLAKQRDWYTGVDDPWLISSAASRTFIERGTPVTEADFIEVMDDLVEARRYFLSEQPPFAS